MDAIIPALNEERTIANVVGPLRVSGCFRSIIVIDDSSTDGTRQKAAEAGAHVYKTPHNLGKGGALLFAYRKLPRSEDPVAFFDADLVGLRPDHVQRMIVATGKGFDMVCGVRDYGPVGNMLQLFTPLITGERIIKRWVLNALPSSCWRGYSIETALNHIVEQRGGKIGIVQLDKVKIVNKVEKTGVVRGLRGHWKMAKEIARTRRALKSSGGLSCDV